MVAISRSATQPSSSFATDGSEKLTGKSPALRSAVLCKLCKHLYVSYRQVNHMDIIPDTGTVWCIVVVAEYIQLRPLTDGHLHDIQHLVLLLRCGTFPFPMRFPATFFHKTPLCKSTKFPQKSCELFRDGRLPHSVLYCIYDVARKCFDIPYQNRAYPTQRACLTHWSF